MKQILKILTLIFLFFFYSCFSQDKGIERQFIFKDSKDNIIFDFENILTSTEEKLLKDKIVDFTCDSKKEVFVITLKSLREKNNAFKMAEYFNSSYSYKKESREIIFIVFNSRKKSIGISTNTMVKSKITDSICSVVIEDYLIPDFKKRRYFEGFDSGLNYIFSLWK